MLLQWLKPASINVYHRFSRPKTTTTHLISCVVTKHASLDGDVCVSRSSKDGPMNSARITLEYVTITFHQQERELSKVHNPCVAQISFVGIESGVPHDEGGTRILYPVPSGRKCYRPALLRWPCSMFERKANTTTRTVVGWRLSGCMRGLHSPTESRRPCYVRTCGYSSVEHVGAYLRMLACDTSPIRIDVRVRAHGPNRQYDSKQSQLIVSFGHVSSRGAICYCCSQFSGTVLSSSSEPKTLYGEDPS